MFEDNETLEQKMGLTNGWTNPLDLVKALGKYCIKQKYYRQGNEFHNFTKDELKVILKADKSPKTPKGVMNPGKICGGYMFIDETNGNTGMVRLYWTKACGVRIVFWEQNGVIEADWD